MFPHPITTEFKIMQQDRSAMKAVYALMLLGVALLVLQNPARADSNDIAAASRNVVRVLVFPADEAETIPIAHGSGVVVAPGMVLTNNHVIDEEGYEQAVRFVIVPSEGSATYAADLVDRSPGNDLALLKTREQARLSVASLFGGVVTDGLDVFAIGYPGGVDIAQGLSSDDIIRPQTPVKTHGNVSTGRSVKAFETLLHTAPIGGGNSGGPLVDACGRVLGINSFGTISDGSDAEFFFAVAVHEITAFLRKNGVSARMVSGPCLSAAEISRAESERDAKARAKTEMENQKLESAKSLTLGDARRRAEYAIIGERENRQMLTMVLLLIAMGTGGAAWQLVERERIDHAKLAGGGAIALLLAGAMTYATRPGFEEVDARVKAALKGDPTPAAREVVAKVGQKVCTIDRARSRITVSDAADVTFDWAASGCVNKRTQYAEDGGSWVRSFVPNTEEQVSIVSFEPDKNAYRIERHLLGNDAMGKARTARNRYDVKACSADKAQRDKVGQMNRVLRELLPDQANEVLLFNCRG
jgi:serine protease Do